MTTSAQDFPILHKVELAACGVYRTGCRESDHRRSTAGSSEGGGFDVIALNAWNPLKIVIDVNLLGLLVVVDELSPTSKGIGCSNVVARLACSIL
jgi:hypothetical protein